MKIAVAEALRSVEQEITAIKATVEREVIAVAERTLEKLKEIDPQLAAQLRPHFSSEPKWDAFKLSLTGDGEIPIKKRGSGIRRLILLSFFRAQAEKRRKEQNVPAVIYAVEEPEASQHPDNRRMIAEALLDLASQPDRQVLLTTHVPALANLMPVEDLRYITRSDDGRVVVLSGAEEDIARSIARTLGSLPDGRVQVIVHVEGPNDVSFLKNISRVLAASDPALPNLAADPRIIMLPVGGSNLQQWVSEDYLSQLGKPEVHIYDRDTGYPPKNQLTCESINQRGDACYLTSKREMENYLHPAAILRGLEVEVALFDDLADVPLLVAKAVHEADPATDKMPWDQLRLEVIAGKVRRAKKRLNEAAAGAMTVELLNGIDPQREVVGWLRRIRSFVT
jgi:hypothetical protein